MATMVALLMPGCCNGHMPRFVNGGKDCSHQDTWHLQSTATYIKLAPNATVTCTFAATTPSGGEGSQQLELSLSVPLPRYSRKAVDHLAVEISKVNDADWRPQCLAGWTGWDKHGGNASAPRLSVAESRIAPHERRSIVHFEPYGIGAYVPVMGCSTPVSLGRNVYTLRVYNGNLGDEVRISVGAGMKEGDLCFSCFGTWLKIKWTLLLWRTWEWGLTRPHFIVLMLVTASVNVMWLMAMVYDLVAVRKCAETDAAIEKKRRAYLVLVASEYALWGWVSNVIVPCLVIFFLHRSDGDVEREGVSPSPPRLVDWHAAYRGTRYHVLPVLALLLLSWATLRFGVAARLDNLESLKSNWIRRLLLCLDLTIALAIDIVWLQFSYLSWAVWIPCLLFAMLPSCTNWEGDVFEPSSDVCEEQNEDSNATTISKAHRSAPWRRAWRGRTWHL
tara:strand:+ start:1614 stop:2951 length:1338 start_codon:yes stop_codon:yes gene_type:complete